MDTGELTERERLPVYAALLTSDNAATGVVQQVTVNLTLACATYLTASLVVLNQSSLSPGVIAILPIPVLLMQTYQLVLASSVRRRTESTREIEWRLVKLAGLEREYRQGYRIGSRATEAATDPHLILRAPGGPRIVKRLTAVAAVLPYLGFYALGIGYSAFVTGVALREDVWWWWMIAIAYGVGWAWFAIVASFAMAIPLPAEATATDPSGQDPGSTRRTKLAESPEARGRHEATPADTRTSAETA